RRTRLGCRVRRLYAVVADGRTAVGVLHRPVDDEEWDEGDLPFGRVIHQWPPVRPPPEQRPGRFVRTRVTLRRTLSRSHRTNDRKAGWTDVDAQTTPAPRNRAMSSAPYPSSSRISSVCSPSSGGAVRMAPGVDANSSGMPAWRITPRAGCSTSTDIPSAAASGEPNAPRT